MASSRRLAYFQTVKRHRSLMSPHTVIYDNHGVEIARIDVIADSPADAEIRADNRFYREHPEFPLLGENEGLSCRVVAHNA